MIKIDNKSMCCGCWACYNACPKHCITMEEDNEGFRYPKIDANLCIDCGLCEKVCPILKPKMDDTIPQSYVVQQKDEEILRTSTSGGFFTSISKYAIENGGVVFGAAFNDDMELSHSYSETLEGCKKFRGSKYVQSLIGETYKQAKSFLDEDRVVIFSGTPCQIAGLYGYLGKKKYENLITVDLVCHGTPSPLLLRKYLAYHAEKLDSPVVDYRSRDKYYGYDFSTATIWFADRKKQYHKGKESDLMLGLYFKNICSRPSCYHCHFKTLHRISDITIFDCWDARSVSHKFSNKGATNVFIHTEKGRLVFEKLKDDFIWASSDINQIIKRDGVMIKNSVPINFKREAFFKDLHKIQMCDIENKYFHRTVINRLIAYCKPVFYKLRIFTLYLSLKKRIM